MRANFIFSEVWIGLRRNLTMTIAVIVTVAVGMALLGIGLMINSQVSSLTTFWTDKVELSVFLCKKDDVFPACKNKPPLNADQKAQLKQTIQVMPQVERVDYEDQAQAYKNFQAQQSNNVLLSVIQPDDLPESFRVKLRNPDNADALADQLTGRAGISRIVNQRKLLESYFGFLPKLRNMALGVAILMVFAATLLIGNTVRLSAYNRRRETGIMRLVGASNIYIQLPFVMEGVIAGLIGGVFAAVLLIVTKILLFEGIQSYMAVPLGWNTVAGVITFTMAVGVVICVLASFITLRRYLRV
ncbi:permease-like cell division protein FtsX [Planotetraspora sp. A-T 1434]|uniref:permease-like cell division protein FtsX n=1 Tax=Planotetraspora sp. A-T 1434 TaxID=2979219 RepID=UPI0021BEC00A|nr:permease-like cell division protein FtsX [Planotetraspora sp. A-T 1434]MCT9928890.1 permease-like cell division protein FtsX [Planotetraspora sp. A-T 1434]